MAGICSGCQRERERVFTLATVWWGDYGEAAPVFGQTEVRPDLEQQWWELGCEWC